MPSLPANGTAGTELPISALATAAAAGPQSSAQPTGELVTLSASERQIPAPVLAAYQQAATTLATGQPACHLRWQLVAGIGKVESGNSAGRQISADGTVSPTILGPRLTGAGGFARITDTDDGRLDHDTAYDRAVGPMQFLPSTWAGAGRDGNADGRKDPNNIHDAALATASYLCAHHRDLAVPAQLNAAIRAYNASDAYVRAVLAWTAGYGATGPIPILVTIIATPGSPPETVAPGTIIFTLTTPGPTALPGLTTGAATASTTPSPSSPRSPASPPVPTPTGAPVVTVSPATPSPSSVPAAPSSGPATPNPTSTSGTPPPATLTASPTAKDDPSYQAPFPIITLTPN